MNIVCSHVHVFILGVALSESINESGGAAVKPTLNIASEADVATDQSSNAEAKFEPHVTCRAGKTSSDYEERTQAVQSAKSADSLTDELNAIEECDLEVRDTVDCQVDVETLEHDETSSEEENSADELKRRLDLLLQPTDQNDKPCDLLVQSYDSVTGQSENANTDLSDVLVQSYASTTAQSENTAADQSLESDTVPSNRDSGQVLVRFSWIQRIA